MFPKQEDYVLYQGEKFQITHAYRKKGQKVDSKELAKAIDLKKDYDARVRKGEYYG